MNEIINNPLFWPTVSLAVVVILRGAGEITGKRVGKRMAVWLYLLGIVSTTAIGYYFGAVVVEYMGNNADQAKFVQAITISFFALAPLQLATGVWNGRSRRIREENYGTMLQSWSTHLAELKSRKADPLAIVQSLEKMAAVHEALGNRKSALTALEEAQVLAEQAYAGSPAAREFLLKLHSAMKRGGKRKEAKSVWAVIKALPREYFLND
jgi:hypothetical protein